MRPLSKNHRVYSRADARDTWMGRSRLGQRRAMTIFGVIAIFHLRQMAGWPRSARGEESPGSTETRCRITSGGGDPRESATENKPPAFVASQLRRGKGETVRQERTARTATDAARQAPPGARPNRDGVRLFPGSRPGRSREAPGNRRPRG